MTVSIAFDTLLILGGITIWIWCFYLRDHPTVTTFGLWWFSLGGTALVGIGVLQLLGKLP